MKSVPGRKISLDENRLSARSENHNDSKPAMVRKDFIMERKFKFRSLLDLNLSANAKSTLGYKETRQFVGYKVSFQAFVIS